MNTNTFEYHLRHCYFGDKNRMAKSLSDCVKAYQSMDLSKNDKPTNLKILDRINQYLNWIEKCKTQHPKS